MNQMQILNKWTGEVAGEVPVANADHIEAALATADAAWRTDWSPLDRAAALERACAVIEDNRQRLVDLMVAETGFTAADASGEIDRGLVTLKLCAQEATRIRGEVVNLDMSPGFSERAAFTLRAPRGVVLAITPFNTPFNGALHKLGPALAAGNSAVLKPAELVPLTAALLVELLHTAGVPKDRLHVLNGAADVALTLLRDDRVAFTTFTGSTRVGTIVKQETGYRPVALELGSIAVTFVCADADLTKAADQIAHAGYRKAGQVCTSVQRVFVAEEVADAFAEMVATRVASLVQGDPREPATQVGPVISAGAATRIAGIISRSVEAGARLLVGGSCQGNLVEPTLLDDVPPDAALANEEVFGPVVGLSRFVSIEDAVAEANRTPFGLQAGIFTASVPTALWVARHMRAGGIVVNGTSSTRADGMPFGGQNASGFGKEGPQYAIREMTVERLVMLG